MKFLFKDRRSGLVSVLAHKKDRDIFVTETWGSDSSSFILTKSEFYGKYGMDFIVEPVDEIAFIERPTTVSVMVSYDRDDTVKLIDIDTGRVVTVLKRNPSPEELGKALIELLVKIAYT